MNTSYSPESTLVENDDLNILEINITDLYENNSLSEGDKNNGSNLNVTTNSMNSSVTKILQDQIEDEV